MIKPKGSSSYTVVVLEVRERNLYRLKGQPMRAMASSSEGAIPNTEVSIGVRNGRVYMLQGKPVFGSKGILDHGSMSITKVKEQKTSKGE